MNTFESMSSIAQLPEAERPSHFKEMAQRYRLPLHRIQALQSFFPHLRESDQGRIQLCGDLSCQLASSPQLLQHIEDWALQQGLRLERCSCLGRCDQGPAALVEGKVRTKLEVEHLDRLLVDPSQGNELPAGLCIDPYSSSDGAFDVLRHCLNQADPAFLLKTLAESGLRGMGGAGFPTGAKWKMVREAEGNSKQMVVNGDESEPGTFKDRFLMGNFPHLVLEGAFLGAWVVGARQVTVFVRHEYGPEIQKLRVCLEEARRMDFWESLGCEVRIVASPGGYICGEETALLEALSERRAEPRSKPPFPGQKGLWDQPTLINNVETLAWIPILLQQGATWWKAQGLHGWGPKLVGLSGHVQRPGVVQVPMGIPIREILEVYGKGVVGGRNLKAFSPGGASSGFLPASMLDLPYNFKSLAEAGSMLGSGALIFLAEGTDLREAALNFTRFFQTESCGKCVPCREGSVRLVELLERRKQGLFTAADQQLLQELAQVMQDASICGLGQAAPIPAMSLLKHFPDSL